MPIIGRCPLCLTPESELQESHILPRWAYRRARDKTSKNANPIVMSGGTAIKSSKQTKEHMLCFSCEQLLGKVDNWASRAFYQDDGRAPIVQWSTRDPTGGSLNLIEHDADRLRRFILSVVWRAHHATEIDPSLGKYADAVRDHLFESKPLPGEIAVVACLLESRPGAGSKCDSLCVLPVSSRLDGYRHHRFIVAGLDAVVAIGQQIDPVLRKYCLVRTSPRILLADSDSIVDWVGPMVVQGRAWRKKRGLPPL